MLDATRLLVQAERCFRLARGAAGPRLADELEALGRAFEQEAIGHEVVEGWHHSSRMPSCRLPTRHAERLISEASVRSTLGNQ